MAGGTGPVRPGPARPGPRVKIKPDRRGKGVARSRPVTTRPGPEFRPAQLQVRSSPESLRRTARARSAAARITSMISAAVSDLDCRKVYKPSLAVGLSGFPEHAVILCSTGAKQRSGCLALRS